MMCFLNPFVITDINPQEIIDKSGFKPFGQLRIESGMIGFKCQDIISFLVDNLFGDFSLCPLNTIPLNRSSISFKIHLLVVKEARSHEYPPERFPENLLTKQIA